MRVAKLEPPVNADDADRSWEAAFIRVHQRLLSVGLRMPCALAKQR